MPNSLFIHFKKQVADCLEFRWPGGSRWELVRKHEKIIDGAWQNGRTPEYTADLIDEIFMSHKPKYKDENPTALAKKWGTYHTVEEA
mgnify:CR=1 FL=1